MSIEPDRKDADRRNLAEVLRELRRAAGLSGERLAARCAMSQSKISRIEKGKTLPTVVDVERILTALEVPAARARELLILARAANADYLSGRMIARTGVWRRQLEVKALNETTAVLRQWNYAGPEVMAKQVVHIADVAARPNVEISVIPLTAEVHDAPVNIFTIHDERLVTIDLFNGGITFRDPSDVKYYLELFDFFLGHALTGDDAISFLRSVASEFM